MNEEITDKSKSLLKVWFDHYNSGGFMMIGEIRNDSLKEDRGNYTQLKKMGLIETFNEDGCVFIELTDKGCELASTL